MVAKEITMLHDIFCKLPVKALVRFKNVCKSWCDQVMDPFFAKFHLSSSPKGLLVQRLRYKKNATVSVRDMYLIEHKSWNDNSVIVTKLGEEVDLPWFEAGLVTSCDGFICLCQVVEGGICHVFNPLTGEYLTLPDNIESPHTDSNDIAMISSLDDTITNLRTRAYLYNEETRTTIGFGFSSESKHFKVVIITRIKTRPNTFDRVEEEAEIYNLATGTWTKIVSIILTRIDDAPGVFLHGALHWLDCIGTRLISFDLEREEFIHGFPILPPLFFRDGNRVQWSNLGTSGGRLHVCDLNGGVGQFPDVDIWVMREYGNVQSWVREIVIRNSLQMWRRGEEIEIVKIAEDGSQILLLCDMHLFAYHPAQRSYTEVKTGDLKLICRSVAYVPSLISLKDIAVGEISKELKF